MKIFDTDNTMNAPTYILDNYGVQALEAVNDWRAKGTSSKDAFLELLQRFSRKTPLSVSVTFVEEDQ